MISSSVIFDLRRFRSFMTLNGVLDFAFWNPNVFATLCSPTDSSESVVSSDDLSEERLSEGGPSGGVDMVVDFLLLSLAIARRAEEKKKLKFSILQISIPDFCLTDVEVCLAFEQSKNTVGKRSFSAFQWSLK